MSALAEALVAAQRRALSALQKTYVHSPLTAEELDAEKDRVRQIMDAIGCIFLGPCCRPLFFGRKP